jgi:hypothetical protein
MDLKGGGHDIFNNIPVSFEDSEGKLIVWPRFEPGTSGFLLLRITFITVCSVSFMKVEQ